MGVLSQAEARAREVSLERGPRKQAPVLLNGLIMGWIRRNVFMEPCY